jgi:hypothetical protein
LFVIAGKIPSSGSKIWKVHQLHFRTPSVNSILFLTGMVFYLFFCIFLAQPSVPVKEKMVDSGDEDYDFDTDLM